MHYGVKGMKWGVRRYQNKDGSLTDLGKNRLYDDESSKALLQESRKNFSSKSGLEKVNEISEAGRFLRKQAKVVHDNFDNYMEVARHDYNNLEKNDKFINEVKKRLGEDMSEIYKKDHEYRELIEMEIEDHVYDCYRKYLSKETNKAHDSFFNSHLTYVENAHKIVDDMVGQYRNEKVSNWSPLKGTNNTSFVNAVGKTIRKLSDENGTYYLDRLAEDSQDTLYFHMVEGVTNRVMKELDR